MEDRNYNRTKEIVKKKVDKAPKIEKFRMNLSEIASLPQKQKVEFTWNQASNLFDAFEGDYIEAAFRYHSYARQGNKKLSPYGHSGIVEVMIREKGDELHQHLRNIDFQ
jgi:hypothetical protein